MKTLTTLLILSTTLFVGPATATPSICTTSTGVQELEFSSAKYPHIKKHTLDAIAAGWPRVLIVNRVGADQRRDRLLRESGLPSRPDEDRDEYPPAVGRGRANGALKGLVQGTNPIGWKASVRYVDDGENASHGSSLGAQLRRLCNGSRFRYVFIG